MGIVYNTSNNRRADSLYKATSWTVRTVSHPRTVKQLTRQNILYLKRLGLQVRKGATGTG